MIDVENRRLADITTGDRWKSEKDKAAVGKLKRLHDSGAWRSRI
jgi:hypothetical protein